MSLFNGEQATGKSIPRRLNQQTADFRPRSVHSQEVRPAVELLNELTF
jgi:hypothetical protein